MEKEPEIFNSLQAQGVPVPPDVMDTLGAEEGTMHGIMENWRQFSEGVELDIEVGDIVLGGKFKNKRIEVKEFGKDALGQPTINGRPILKFRIEKHLPDAKKSKKTRDLEKAEEEGEKE